MAKAWSCHNKSMKKSLLCLFSVLTIGIGSRNHAARANDSAFSGVGGTPKPMRGEHRSIAMQSERIVIVADAKGYSTDVDFVFRNDGAAQSVQMGFPENSFGDSEAATKSAFLRFGTMVEGRAVKAKRVVIASDSPETEAYWLKTVAFPARSTRRVRVSYRSPWGGNTEWGTRHALAYAFTGQNWKGKVERSDLEIRVATPGLWVAMPRFSYPPQFESLPLAMTRQDLPENGASNPPDRVIFRKTWRNWQAQGSFLFGLTRTIPFWMLDRGSMSIEPGRLASAQTFRIGKVPADLPVGVDLPPGFLRGGVAYGALNHIENRLSVWAYDLREKLGIPAPVSLIWDAKARVSTLKAGAKTLKFSPDTPALGSKNPNLLLQGEFGPTLFVPLAPLAKTLGLGVKIDAKNRLFELKQGSWKGK